jgi:hypothetical protein
MFKVVEGSLTGEDTLALPLEELVHDGCWLQRWKRSKRRLIIPIHNY